MGCTLAQGYLFGRPMPLGDTGEFLRTSAPVGLAAPMPKLSLEQRASQILALYRSSDVSISFLTPDYTVVDASETFARRMGRPLAGVIGRHIADLLPTATAWLSSLRDIRASVRRHPTFEIRLPTGGSELVATQVVYDEAGELLGFSIISMDVSGRSGKDEPLPHEQPYLHPDTPPAEPSSRSGLPRAAARNLGLGELDRGWVFHTPIWTFGAGRP